MLNLRQALKTVLGASFSVTHQGNPVTVLVGDAGSGDEKALPAVFVISQVGVGAPANIGGGAARNEAFCDLLIQTLDSDTIDGARLLDDIHQKVEDLVRAVEKTVGGSYYTYVSSYRDAAPQAIAGLFAYTRTIMVRGTNYDSY